MKAAVYRRYGSPDVVTADQAPTPVPPARSVPLPYNWPGWGTRRRLGY
jgi:hypothetical protein